MTDDKVLITENWATWVKKRKKFIIANTIFQGLWLWFTLTLWAEHPDGRVEVICGMQFLLLAWILLIWWKTISVAFSPNRYEIASTNGHFIVTRNDKVVLDIAKDRLKRFDFVTQKKDSLAFKLDYLSDANSSKENLFLINLVFIPEVECRLFAKFSGSVAKVRGWADTPPTQIIPSNET